MRTIGSATYVTREERKLIFAVVRAWLKPAQPSSPIPHGRRPELPLTEVTEQVADYFKITNEQVVEILECAGAY